MQTTLTSFDAAFKPLFSKERIAYMAYTEQPVAGAWIAKSDRFTGGNRGMEVPVFHGLTSHSKDFSTAQGMKRPTKSKRFAVTRVRDYALLSINNETLEASEGDEGSFMRAQEAETRAAFTRSGQNLARGIFGNIGDSIGVVSATGLTATAFVFTDADATVHVEEDDQLEASDNDGRDSTDTLLAGVLMVVSGIDRLNGTVTVDTTSGLGAGDFVFHRGNFRLGVSGFDDWIPPADPTSGDDFFGVARDTDPIRLAGFRFDGTMFSTMEAIERAMAFSRRQQAMIDSIIVNHARFTEISLEMGAKAVQDTVGSGSFAFDAIRIHSGGRPVKVMADHNCKGTDAWLLTKSTWKLHLLKGGPRFLGKTGSSSPMIVEPTNDGWEYRVGWYGNVICYDTSKNGRCLLSAA